MLGLSDKILHKYCALWLTILTSILALLSTIFLDHQWLLDFVDEGHLVENITLVFYAIAIVFILTYKQGAIKFVYRFALAFILLAMLAREADLHKVLGMSMLKIKFWLTSASSISDKLIAAVILAAIGWAIIVIIKDNYKAWYQNLKKQQPYAISILVFFAVLVISKILDRSLNIINEIWGWQAPRWLVALQQPQEEYLECILPLLIMIAVVQYVDYKKQKI